MDPNFIVLGQQNLGPQYCEIKKIPHTASVSCIRHEIKFFYITDTELEF